MNKIIVTILAVLILVVVQISLITAWPPPVQYANIVLAVVIFVSVLANQEFGLALAAVSGFLLDLYSPHAFGLTILSLVFVSWVVSLLFRQFFTNRSLYPLFLLGLAGTFFFETILLLGGYVFNDTLFAAGVFWSWLTIVSWEAFLNLLILGVLFIIFNRFTDRFHLQLTRFDL